MADRGASAGRPLGEVHGDDIRFEGEGVQLGGDPGSLLQLWYSNPGRDAPSFFSSPATAKPHPPKPPLRDSKTNNNINSRSIKPQIGCIYAHHLHHRPCPIYARFGHGLGNFCEQRVCGGYGYINEDISGISRLLETLTLV